MVIKSNYFEGKIFLSLSLLVSLLVFIASFCGIFINKTYLREAEYFAVQGVGQDIVNLSIVVPALIISSVLFYRNSIPSRLIWSGIILYLIYSYAIYCFSMHFNFLFLVYCSIFGLSFYLFLLHFNFYMRNNLIYSFNSKLIKYASAFLIILSSLFYLMWLSEIIPALIKDEIPKSVIENGIVTNPVHVLDLSIVLPAFIIIAILLLKKSLVAYLLTPAFLTFCVLMCLAIIGMIFSIYFNKMNVNLLIVIIFFSVALIGSVLLYLVLKKIKYID